MNYRKKRPWIVVFGHRPMYCSNSNHKDCTHHETITRVGLPFLHAFGECSGSHRNVCSVIPFLFTFTESADPGLLFTVTVRCTAVTYTPMTVNNMTQYLGQAYRLPTRSVSVRTHAAWSFESYYLALFCFAFAESGGHGLLSTAIAQCIAVIQTTMIARIMRL